MRTAVIVFVGACGALTLVTAAAAQEGLATSGTLGGHNTIQQAPSGGRGGDSGATPGSSVGRGEPTAEERQLEKRNNETTQICKGC